MTTRARRQFAEKTKVSVGRTQEELRKLVLERGATGWAIGEDEGRALVQFRLSGRVLRFRVNLTQAPGRGRAEAKRVDEREERRRWRSLFMAVKAKLVIAEDGIESFDEIFLANIVTPDGDTIADRLIPQIAPMLEQGKPILLLPERTP